MTRLPSSRRSQPKGPRKPNISPEKLQPSIRDMRSRLFGFLPELMQTTLNLKSPEIFTPPGPMTPPETFTPPESFTPPEPLTPPEPFTPPGPFTPPEPPTPPEPAEPRFKSVTSVAWPVANETFTDEIHNLISQAANHQMLKRGANETIKALERGRAELVVLAADTVPLAIVSIMPRICEEKDVLWIYVPSKLALGRACRCNRSVSACTITTDEHSELQGPLAAIQEKVERMLI